MFQEAVKSVAGAIAWLISRPITFVFIGGILCYIGFVLLDQIMVPETSTYSTQMEPAQVGQMMRLSYHLSITSLGSGIVLVALGVAAMIFGGIGAIIASGNTQTAVQVYNETKAFFSSPIFFVLLGCLFLYIAWKEMINTHSAFVFLLAMLGVAILLYGTGTQAAGTARTKAANVGVLNVAIAGGAGVLAAVFGWGVVHYSKDIQNVFKRNVDYGVLELTGDPKILNFYDVRAEQLDGRQLHILKKDNHVEVMVPYFGVSSQSFAKINVSQKQATDVGAVNQIQEIKELQPDFNLYFEIEWSPKGSVRILRDRDNATASIRPATSPEETQVEVRHGGTSNEEILWITHNLVFARGVQIVEPKNNQGIILAPSVMIVPQ